MHKGGYSLEFVLKFILFITLTSPILFGIRNFFVGGRLNDKWECKSCKVISRKGIWKLYNSNIDKEHPLKLMCPVCEELSKYDETYHESPLAPRLSLLQRYNVNKVVENNTKAFQKDKQLELYLKVQNVKLEKMKARKDEVNV